MKRKFGNNLNLLKLKVINRIDSKINKNLEKMSLSGEMIKYLAQLEGIPELNDECANVLAKDVEYRLRELIQVLIDI